VRGLAQATATSPVPAETLCRATGIVLAGLAAAGQPEE